VVLLGKCEDDAETQWRIATYFDRGIPLANIKMHPDNGGSEEDYGYIHLGVPVGSERRYQLNHLNYLVDKFIEICECENRGGSTIEVGVLTMGHSPKNSFLV
jgi:hypothetical protein